MPEIQVVATYCRYLRDALHFTPAVVRRHELWVGRWIAFCEDRAIDWANCHRSAAQEFIHAWRGTVGPSTLGHAISHLRTFYTWAVDEGLAVRNPFATIRRPRLPKMLPRYLTEDEIARMIAALNGRRLKDLRDRAILEVLYSTGCRLNELRQMNVEDIDWDRGTVVVMGKGGKERVCYLTPSALAAIRAYLRWGRRREDMRRASNPVPLRGKTPLFLGTHGRRIPPQSIRDAIRRAAARAGIRKRVYTHLIRHTVATHLRMRGAAIDEIARLLGHENLSTTQIYVHVADPALERAWRSYHPLMAAKTQKNTG